MTPEIQTCPLQRIPWRSSGVLPSLQTGVKGIYAKLTWEQGMKHIFQRAEVLGQLGLKGYS